jgi:hypothetical protein
MFILFILTKVLLSTMSVYLFTYLFECISLTLDLSITYIVIKYILVFKCNYSLILISK